MSDDMRSQESEHDSDYDHDSDHMDDDDDYGGYYDNDTDDLDIDKPKKSDDPEFFEYELLQVEDVERFLNEEVEVLCSSQKVRLNNLRSLQHLPCVILGTCKLLTETTLQYNLCIMKVMTYITLPRIL